MPIRRSPAAVALLSLSLTVFAVSTASLDKAPAKKNSHSQPQDKPAASQASEQNAPALESDYVGGEACLTCHDIQEAFKKNPHYKNWEDSTKAWSQRGCESCHGPGREHAESADPTKIFNFKKVAPQKVSDRCLDCHLKLEEHTNFLRNEHGVNSVACTECHSVHTPHVEKALLQASTPALCYNCHGEVRAQFRKPFRHKVNEGLMSCTDCHNQHGGFNVRQLRETAGTDIACFKCHADKQGPFVYEHAPVKVEGCTLCHDAHSSVNPRMLKRAEVRFLCLECHADTPGILGPATPEFHNLSQQRFQNCTVCHVNIHGSNLSPVFFQ